MVSCKARYPARHGVLHETVWRRYELGPDFAIFIPLVSKVLKRRGPVLADPITLDLPQPVAAIRLRARPAAEALAPRQSLHTIHARQDTRRPVSSGASGTVLPEPLRA